MRNHTDKEMLSEFMNLEYALMEIKRTGGCIPLSDKAENEAQEILKKMKKKKFSLIDVFKAIRLSAEKRNEKIKTKYLLSAAPYSSEDIDRLIELSN